MDMTSSNDNAQDITLLRRVWDWRQPLIIAGLLGGLISAAASFLIEPEFQSSVVLFALPQQSIGAQFYEEVKREDILAYGETEDAERLLQILNSDRIRRRVIEKYDLWSHYSIDRAHAGNVHAVIFCCHSFPEMFSGKEIPQGFHAVAQRASPKGSQKGPTRSSNPFLKRSLPEINNLLIN